MTTIVTRAAKGSALTWVEADANVTNLNTAKLESLSQDIAPSLGGNLDTLSQSISSSTGNVLINDTATIQKVQIDTAITTGSTLPGMIAWNDIDGTLEFQAKGGNVTLQIGQETILRIHNGTGTAFTDGQVIMITGSTGNYPSAALASATTGLLSATTIGIVTEPIANGDDGFVTTNGMVHGLNTLAYTAGDILWLSTTAGALTNVMPVSPLAAVMIGLVIKRAGGDGSIYVNVDNMPKLYELSDVLLTTPATDNALIYDGTTLVWRNQVLKTVNSNSIVGSGDIAVQPTLVSGTNIKTINSQSLLGSGDIAISGGGAVGFEQIFMLGGM